MDDLEWLKKHVKQLLADRWAGAPLKNGLPRMPQLKTLPTASKDYEGRLVYIPYSSTGPTKGRFYGCRLAADGVTWEWVALDN